MSRTEIDRATRVGLVEKRIPESIPGTGCEAVTHKISVGRACSVSQAFVLADRDRGERPMSAQKMFRKA